MTTALASLTTDLAAMFGVKAEATEIVETLKQTAFKSREPVSDAQLFALLVIAKQYRLNPWTREIYAYPDERKGIVPVVGIDGWIRIVNEHPQCDGWEFDNHPNNQFVTCRQFRKDRTRPLPATEFIDECLRQTDPWKKMPRRMLRHKAFIQSARLAYGFAFYDEEDGAAAAGVTIDNDTGEIVEPKRGPQRKSSAAPTPPAASAPPPAAAPALPAYADEAFAKNLPLWAKLVADGKKAPGDLLATLATKATFSEEQKARILSLKKAPEAGPAPAAPAAPTPAPADGGEHDDFIGQMDAAEEAAK